MASEKKADQKIAIARKLIQIEECTGGKIKKGKNKNIKNKNKRRKKCMRKKRKVREEIEG